MNIERVRRTQLHFRKFVIDYVQMYSRAPNTINVLLLYCFNCYFIIVVIRSGFYKNSRYFHSVMNDIQSVIMGASICIDCECLGGFCALFLFFIIFVKLRATPQMLIKAYNQIVFHKITVKYRPVQLDILSIAFVHTFTKQLPFEITVGLQHNSNFIVCENVFFPFKPLQNPVAICGCSANI